MTSQPVFPALSDAEFRRFRELIHEAAGIHLGEAKKALLAGRLGRRLRALGLRTFGEYYAHVTAGGDGEAVRMLDAVTTNETRFFREPAHFEFLARRVLPALQGRARRRLRVWSAACSTGEEPYSLAMLALSRLPAHEGWAIEIVASDISTRVLEHARRAVYSLQRADEVPAALRQRYLLRGVRAQAGRMRAGPELRALVTFERFNLAAAEWPPCEPFDWIFCRNALIYFDAATRARVVERLLDRLAPDGYLFLGHAESLAGLNERTRCLVPTVYALRGAAPPR